MNYGCRSDDIKSFQPRGSASKYEFDHEYPVVQEVLTRNYMQDVRDSMHQDDVAV